MYSALSVASHIINYCNDQGSGVSNLKLQKILYFVQAEFLVSTRSNSPCFSDTIEAWDFGPVVPVVYRQYKIYGSSIIPTDDRDPLAPFYDVINAEDIDMIDRMVDQTLPYSASQLVQITHSQDPWRNSYQKGFNNVITNNSILSFFRE